MIEAINLTKFYGSRHVVKNLSFTVERNVITGFLGGNGAGKSTTMRMLTGFLPPSAGTVKIGGVDLAENPLAAQRQFGYLPESNPLYRDMRVDEFLDYRAQLKDIPRRDRRYALDRVLENCRLQEVAQQIIGQLSKGYRQRVGLADCLLGDPPLLILDEPTVGLDPNQVRQTRGLIQELGVQRTVFLSTHLLNEVEMICERVIIIQRGEIAGNAPTRELCHDFSGERFLRLQLSVESTGSDPRTLFSNLPEIIAVEEMNRAGDSYFFRLRCARDLRSEIANLVVAKNYFVEEITLEPVRLEDVFEQLTQKNYE